MANWITKYHGIGLMFEDKIIRIKNDENLKTFLKDEMNSARKLSLFIRKAYRYKFQKELNITNESLAIEIWAHFHIQEVNVFLEQIAKLIPGGKIVLKGTDWMALHMEVIDCGERDVDNNRFLWDWMAKSEAFQTKVIDQFR